VVAEPAAALDACSSAANTAGTPTIAVTPSRATRSAALIGLKRSIVVTRPPASSGATPDTTSPNRCENGSTASEWSSGVNAPASTGRAPLATRLRCVSTAPSGRPAMADV
jgi:hypothetical protein